MEVEVHTNLCTGRNEPLKTHRHNNYLLLRGRAPTRVFVLALDVLHRRCYPVTLSSMYGYLPGIYGTYSIVQNAQTEFLFSSWMGKSDRRANRFFLSRVGWRELESAASFTPQIQTDVTYVFLKMSPAKVELTAWQPLVFSDRNSAELVS